MGNGDGGGGVSGSGSDDSKNGVVLGGFIFKGDGLISIIIRGVVVRIADFVF